MKQWALAGVIVALAAPAWAQSWVPPRAPARDVEQVQSQVPVPSGPRNAVRRTYQYPPSESLFEGFYAGLGLGADIFRVRGEQRVPTVDGTGVFRFHRTSPGFAGDVFFGFGRLFGPGIYGGAELEFGYASVRGRSTGQVAVAPNTYTVTVSQRYDAHFAAMLRLGYTFTPNLMGYGRFGWGLVHSTFDFTTDQNGGARFDSQRSGRWLQGPRVGAGLEYAYRHNIRVRAEYLFTWLFEHMGDGRLLGGPPGVFRDATFIRSNAHSLRLAIVYGL